MMPDQRDAYVAQNPSVDTVELPSGWARIRSMPTFRPVTLLRSDGEIFDGLAPSNPQFLMDLPLLYVGWRP